MLRDQPVEPFVLPDLNSVTISYHGLRPLSGAIKQLMIDELTKITKSADPRKMQALWELGVMHLSRYTDPDAKAREGLSYVHQAAEAGDIRAKALYDPLCEAFGAGCRQNIRPGERKWLVDAASAGHQAAVARLGGRGSHRLPPVAACQADFAATRFQPAPNAPVANWDHLKSISARQDTALHRAAATGNTDHVQVLLEQALLKVNALNLDGDTPLILACRFGQIEAVRLLLAKGADASICNSFGENGLHFCWCFYGRDSLDVIDMLIEGGAKLDAIAKGHPLAMDLDVLPMLPGTPAERAAGRRRMDVFVNLLTRKNILCPSNGNVARRMLVWALRLHDTRLQRLLLDQDDPQSVDSDLLPLFKTQWLHKGEERNLIDAACAGWVSGSRHEWDVPRELWSAACNGAKATEVLEKSITNVVDWFSKQQQPLERLLDTSAIWAFRESMCKPFTILLGLKATRTSATRSVLNDLDLLRWSLSGENPAPM